MRLPKHLLRPRLAGLDGGMQMGGGWVAGGSELGARFRMGGMRMKWVAHGRHGTRMGAEVPWGLRRAPGPDTKSAGP